MKIRKPNRITCHATEPMSMEDDMIPMSQAKAVDRGRVVQLPLFSAKHG